MFLRKFTYAYFDDHKQPPEALRVSVGGRLRQPESCWWWIFSQNLVDPVLFSLL